MQRAYKTDKFTLRDYLTWPDDERWEIIGGVAYSLHAHAAPLLNHQRLSGYLFTALHRFLEGKRCEVFAGPIDVAFEHDDCTDTVVQPDIIVVCDPEKLKSGKRVIGAPDLIVEILSPSTAVKDSYVKKELYQRHGVAEYWIASPDENMILQYRLENGRYDAGTSYFEETLKTPLFEGFELDLNALFAAIEQPTGGA